MICGIQNLKYDTNEPVYKTETDTENKFMVNKEERAQWAVNQEFEIMIQITIYKINKVLTL